MFDVSREEITEGSLPRALFVLAAPLIAQNFALVAQQVIDIFWVGRLGTTAVAAVGLVIPLTALSMVPLVACFTGSQVLVSQRAGAGNVDGARRVPTHGVAIALVVGLAVALVVFVAGDELVGLFGPAPDVRPLSVTYLKTYAFAVVLTGVSDTLESGFTGWGDTRAALYVNLAAIVVNVVLDPFLILGWGPFPEWGVFGAAVATGVGYGVGGLFALALLYRGRGRFRLTRASFRHEPGLAGEIVRVGGPVAVQGAGRHLARLLVVAVVSFVGGTAGLAAYNVGARAATVAFVPAQGLSQASTSIVGQNLGADRPDRADRATWLGVAVAVVGLSVVGVVQWLYPAAIAELFIPDVGDPTRALTVDYLRILVLGYWALGAIYAVEAGFNGARRTTVSMASTLLQYWLVRVPFAAVGAFVLGWGVHAVFWAVTVSNVVAALGLAGYYRYATDNGMLERAAETAAD